ncbi:MAG TPA: hypothetical protein VHX38_21540 [Pseudonocardiaceae bacterium]|nr:hypothetical protein [Pseudonocardiaceae bacterium]
MAGPTDGDQQRRSGVVAATPREDRDHTGTAPLVEQLPEQVEQLADRMDFHCRLRIDLADSNP